MVAKHFYAQTIEKVLEALQSSQDKGLTSREAKERLEERTRITLDELVYYNEWGKSF